MSGVVFHNISEGIMAQALKLDVKDARDSASITIPDVKDRNIMAADYVLQHLGVKSNIDWGNNTPENNTPIWGRAETSANKGIALRHEKLSSDSAMPNVQGMGARDAVYQIEKRGVKVVLKGRGKVTKKSLTPGQTIKKGDICMLTLE